MAVTIAVVRRSRLGNHRLVTADITGPVSYATGGEVLTAAQYANLFPEIAANAATAAFSNVTVFVSETSATTTPAFLAWVLDKAGNKMVSTTAGAQTANLTNLSAQTVRAKFEYQYSTG